MDFLLKLKGFKKYYGMDVSLMKGDDTLDTITISDDEGSGKKLTFETEESKEELFGGEATAEFKVVFTDENGDSRNFRKGETNLFDLDPDEQTETATLKAKKKKAKIKVKLQGEKIQDEEPPEVLPEVLPDENETGTTITLTAQQDVYSEAFGGSVIGADFVQNELRFTAGADTVFAAAGTLGATDDLSDASTGDGDQLNLTTNAQNNLENAVANVVQVAGLEDFTVTSTNDNSAVVNLTTLSGVESFRGTGTFDNQVEYQNYLLSGARNFDFSGVTTGGVNFTNTNAGVNTSDALTLTGSSDDDVLQANNGAAQLRGRGGVDNIVGSAVVGSTVTGGSGRDVVTLQAAASVDVVSLVTITATNNGDDITGFIGANTNANAADLLRFDASTFNTYTAGTQVTEANQATADASQASNLFIVDTAANIANVNTQTGEGTLALANDTGVIFYASNGNFANAVDIGTIDDFANFVATANVDIV